MVSPLFEQWIWKYLHILNLGDCSIDIGAHIGKYTIQVARIIGDEGLVLSIEAHPDNYKILVENILINHLTVEKLKLSPKIVKMIDAESGIRDFARFKANIIEASPYCISRNIKN